MNPYLLVEMNRLRYDEFLRQATQHSMRSGRREPRRTRRGRHRER